MHVSIIQSGFFLARLGRPEVQNCIEGLEQYSYAYEETKELSQMIRREYEQTLIKGPSFHEMSNTIPRRTPPVDTTNATSSPNGNGVHHAHHDSMVSPMSSPSSLVLRFDRTPIAYSICLHNQVVSMLSIPYSRLPRVHRSPCKTYDIIIRLLPFSLDIFDHRFVVTHVCFAPFKVSTLLFSRVAVVPGCLQLSCRVVDSHCH